MKLHLLYSTFTEVLVLSGCTQCNAFGEVTDFSFVRSLASDGMHNFTFSTAATEKILA